MSEKNFEDHKQETKSFYDMGIEEHKKHNTEVALDYMEKSIELNKKIDSKSGLAWSIYYKGIIYHERNLGLEKAIEFFQEALDLFREIDEKDGIGKILYNFAWTYRDKGEYDKAMNFAKEHLELRLHLGEKTQIGWGHLIIAWIYTSMKKFDFAKSEFLKSIEIFQEAKEEKGIAFAKRFYAMSLKESNNIEEALENFQFSSKYFENEQNLWQQAICLAEIGEIFEKKEDIKKADSYYNKALSLVLEINNVGAASNILNQLISIYKSNNPKKADYYQKQLSELEKTKEKKSS